MEDKFLTTIIIFGMLIGTYVVGMLMGIIKTDGTILGTLAALAGTVIGYLYGQQSGHTAGYHKCLDEMKK